MPSLVAIVVAHDSADVLPGCLAALAGQHVPAIVVDNASRDASASVAEAAGAQVIRNARNEGYGRANNRGVRAAETAEHVLIVNPDVVLRPGAVDALLEAARSWPDAGLLAPRLVEPDVHRQARRAGAGAGGDGARPRSGESPQTERRLAASQQAFVKAQHPLHHS